MRYSILLIALSSALVAQDANPLSSELKENYNMRKSDLLAEAGKMSDADYSFKATPNTRTFGQNVAHVADAQMMICSAINDEKKTADTKGKTSKADILAALKASFDYCDSVYNSFTDSTATQTVTIFGHPQT